ncbi:MAG: Acetoin dehydrogenase operon transcriptional activator AcoR [Smithella sp. PtaU1.Bin162]|nr:MAG: Acetoin dehydrogenase operon transcriptional activator AcoR [Smithella sp. PtaU1.Bin162]
MQRADEKFDKILGQWRRYFKKRSTSIDTTIIPSAILDSWNRSKEKNINPYIKKNSVLLEGRQLRELLEVNSELINISIPFMKNLHSCVAGSGYILALFDYQGYLLELLGDEDIVNYVKPSNFVIGSCWSEDIMGTNGAGTAIVEVKPVQIFGPQHYCICSRHWSGSGAPIHNPEGKLIGAIALTGPYEVTHAHGLGMVAAVTYAIENSMRVRKALTEVNIAKSYQETVISSIPEAIVAIDNDANVTLINHHATEIFGLPSGQVAGRQISDICNKDNQNFISMIMENESLIDAEVTILKNRNSYKYTLTCNSITTSNQKTIGKIIILNEINRAKTLVNNMTGAKAKIKFDDLIGDEIKFLETIEMAKLISSSVSNVLLLGESGTGKDVFAQAIHNESNRSNGPYIAINCAAIPRDLISSELFGYSDGAFTGSRKGGSQGKFELADGGTLFLDEIGEMPLELQAILLRVIEDKSITKIGGDRTTSVNVRIIAATNKDLKEEIRNKKFREDLYYRFSVFTLKMIPLRERKEDIPILAQYFVQKISNAINKINVKINDDVLAGLKEYSWPGNIRELQNVIERMIYIAKDSTLTVDLMPQEIIINNYVQKSNNELSESNNGTHKLILSMMQSHIPKTKIAEKLCISRSTLYRLLREY